MHLIVDHRAEVQIAAQAVVTRSPGSNVWTFSSTEELERFLWTPSEGSSPDPSQLEGFCALFAPGPDSLNQREIEMEKLVNVILPYIPGAEIHIGPFCSMEAVQALPSWDCLLSTGKQDEPIACLARQIPMAYPEDSRRQRTFENAVLCGYSQNCQESFGVSGLISPAEIVRSFVTALYAQTEGWEGKKSEPVPSNIGHVLRSLHTLRTRVPYQREELLPVGILAALTLQPACRRVTVYSEEPIPPVIKYALDRMGIQTMRVCEELPTSENFWVNNL